MNNDTELPDFPWRREEVWLEIETKARQAYRDSLARKLGDHVDLSDEATQRNMEDSIDDFMDRIRGQFDFLWDLTPFTATVENLTFHVEVPVTKESVQAAVDHFKDDFTRKFQEKLAQWQGGQNTKIMQKLMEYELRIFALENQLKER